MAIESDDWLKLYAVTCAPAFSLGWRGMADVNFFDAPAGLGVLSLVGLLVLARLTVRFVPRLRVLYDEADYADSLGGSLAVGFIAFFYAFGAINLGDASFDRSAPVSYRALVMDKWKLPGGKSPAHYLRLAEPRGVRAFIVPRSLYNEAQPGAHMCMTTHAGALGIPWYTYRFC